MRKEVKWFAEQMEKILKENDGKGGWQQEDLSYLFESLRAEVGELRVKLPPYGDVESVKDRKGTIKECVDLANFAMMIADNVKRLEEGA